MKKLGKVLIVSGFVLIGIPFLYAILYSGYTAISLRNSWIMLPQQIALSYAPTEQQLPQYMLILVNWVTRISTYPRLSPNFPFLLVFSRLFWLFIPNILIISGFAILVNQNKRLEIKKCFNITVIIGFLISILVLLRFFGLYPYLYRGIFINYRFFNPLRMGLPMGIVRFLYGILSIIFHIIPAVPTFIITLGYMKFFEKEKTQSSVIDFNNGVSIVDSKLSYFDGGLLSYIGWKIAGFFITLFTLGICYPWALCMVYGWKVNHTTIDGKRLKFNGKAISLFGHWILWGFLTIITLGIYSFWLSIALKKWIVKNTSIVNSDGTEKPLTSDLDNKPSYFDGGLLSYIGWKIAGFFITLFTLGICYPWALCMVYGWEINHSVIEGKRQKFNGKAISLLGHWILWVFLTFITFGIYSFWLTIALEKWKVKNTTFENIEPSIEAN